MWRCLVTLCLRVFMSRGEKNVSLACCTFGHQAEIIRLGILAGICICLPVENWGASSAKLSISRSLQRCLQGCDGNCGSCSTLATLVEDGRAHMMSHSIERGLRYPKEANGCVMRMRSGACAAFVPVSCADGN